MTTLISFLGKTEANRGYRLANYRFECGFELSTSFFGVAVLSRERARINGAARETPTRWIIIGTPTSGWDQLEKCVAQLAPNFADAALEWALPVSEELAANGSVSPANLRAFESDFSTPLKIDIRLCAVDNDADAIFGALQAHLDKHSRVVLDVTHGFRAMPMHALLALGALRWLSHIEITDILYGNFEQKYDDGACRAQSLKTSARLAHFTPALAQLELVDDVGHIGELFESSNPQLFERLREAHRLESLMQHNQSAGPRGQALGVLRKFNSASAIDSACAKAVESVLERLKYESGAEGLRARACIALTRNDFMRALGLANEALLLRVVELRGLRTLAEAELARGKEGDATIYKIINRLAKEEFRAQCSREGAPGLDVDGRSVPAQRALNLLNDARNAVMHAGTGMGGQRPPESLNTASGLTSLIDWSFHFFDFMK